MAAPGTIVASGAVRSTNANLDVRTPGFRPRVVILHTAGASLHWQDGMPDASGYKRIAAGTGSLISTLGITPLSDGFRIGADAVVNPAAADDIRWLAIS